ncbi:MAG: hypothetical protein VB131_05085 [Burkholderia gladioli]
MTVEEFAVGDLVEVVNVKPTERRVLAGQHPWAIENGEQGIVTELYRHDFRVQCGSNAAMKWEANLRADEVRLVARLGREEATSRLLGI